MNEHGGEMKEHRGPVKGQLPGSSRSAEDKVGGSDEEGWSEIAKVVDKVKKSRKLGRIGGQAQLDTRFRRNMGVTCKRHVMDKL
ncbi:unnamed protein product [Bursaphelenchus xylophilus]|uniref:(pine wood nematode) hypothetical protein n=1 Tax=Bursaphelenchus xylophilus TaxID=6326 RepID=A0A1I7SVE0_BURXY|nr:unnamed protein product [Bursaphelenchus xylophilus]CAG9101302.1 unnamed protein product [Bursaphelenchus xylophilus]